MGGKINEYSILVGKPEGERPLGRPTRGWEDNIKMNRRKIQRWGLDWIHLAHDIYQWRALVNMVINFRVP
jgi:hypothetical protein